MSSGASRGRTVGAGWRWLLVLWLSMPAGSDAREPSAGLARTDRIRELIPVYRQALSDARLAELAAAVELDDRESIDAWLLAMPLSPLDLLAVRRQLQRSEMPVRRLQVDFHRRWLALHPEEGRRLHGDAAVAAALRGYSLDLESGLEASTEEGAPAQGAAVAASAVGTNRNVAADDDTEPEEYQGEVQIVVDPADPNRIVAAANTWDDMGGACGALGMQAVFHSSDGGVTWGYTCAPDEASFSGVFPALACPATHPLDFGSDPALAWSADGSVYLEYMLLCLNLTGTSVRYSLVVARSGDGGATWSPHGVVANSLPSASAFEDKPFYVIDRFPESPYSGRHYTCWDRNNDQKLAYSGDDGATWTEVDLPTPVQGTHEIGCDLAVADSGVVHVVWNRLTCLSQFSPCTEGRMFHSRSSDGGATWSTPVLVNEFVMVDFGGGNCASAQEERCLNAFGSIDVDNSGGPCRGTLYIAYTDIPTGTEPHPDKANVYVRSSADAGASWGAAVQVHSDDRFAFNANFHPWLEVDRGTRHAVAAWHDTRNHTDHNKVDYFVGRSDDCGATWIDEQVSAASVEFKNSGISYSSENAAENDHRNPNQYGEYLGLDLAGGRAYIAWTDSRQFEPELDAAIELSQKENVGFVEVRFPEIFLDGFETGDTRVWTGDATGTE